MSTGKTTNYELSQWEFTDRILMEDFNDDNSKIDEGIKTAQDTADAALGTANTAQSTADGAASAAAAAQNTANTAKTTAENAASAAATAQSTANTAKTNAATAQSTANTAKTNAANAQSTANSAVTAAANAQTTANNALAGNSSSIFTYVGNGANSFTINFPYKPAIAIIWALTSDSPSSTYFSRQELLYGMSYGRLYCGETSPNSGSHFAVSWSGNRATVTVANMNQQNKNGFTYTVLAIR